MQRSDRTGPIAQEGTRVVDAASIGAAAALRPTNLPSHLRLGEPIGVGGTAVLWRARDRHAGRDVAVKVLGIGADRERVVSRFTDEVRAMARLSEHRHVLPLLAAGSDESTCWLVVPLAQRSLAEAIWPPPAPGRAPGRAPAPAPGRAPGPTRGGTLSGSTGVAMDLHDLMDLAESIACALGAAHDLDVVHGDVTPANVLRLEHRWVLADFGTSAVQAAVGPSSPPGATPGWAAPERLDGSSAVATPSSDVFGWATTVWSAATGERPVGVGAQEVASLPRGLSSVVADCLHPDPTRRPGIGNVVDRVASERRRRDRYIPDP